MADAVEPLPIPPSMLLARRRSAAQRAAASITGSLVQNEALWEDTVVVAASTSSSSSSRRGASSTTTPVDTASDEFKAKYADTMMALNYCYQRSPDSVAANALMSMQHDQDDDDDHGLEEDGDAGANQCVEQQRTARRMQAAYEAVYQSFQPMMLLAERVVDFHKNTQKVEIAPYMADDLAVAIADADARKQDSEYRLPESSKRSEQAELVVTDPELAALLAPPVAPALL